MSDKPIPTAPEVIEVLKADYRRAKENMYSLDVRRGMILSELEHVGVLLDKARFAKVAARDALINAASADQDLVTS